MAITSRTHRNVFQFLAIKQFFVHNNTPLLTVFCMRYFFPVLYYSSLLPSEGPYPYQGPISYVGQIHPSQLLLRRLSVKADDVVLFVTLRSKIYDVTHRHRANLFRLRLPFAQKESVKSAFLCFQQMVPSFLFSARENNQIN